MQLLRWFFHIPDSPIGITKSLRRELDSLAPGQSLRLRADDGTEFTIMPSDDFEHIARLAGLREVPADQVNER